MHNITDLGFKYHDGLDAHDAHRLHSLIAVYQDWPEPGVTFRDIMPACADADTFQNIMYAMEHAHMDDEEITHMDDEEITHVVGVESRGLIFGAALAKFLGVGFVAARKAKERPW